MSAGRALFKPTDWQNDSDPNRLNPSPMAQVVGGTSRALQMGPSVRLQGLRAEGKVALSCNASAPGKHDYSRSSLNHICLTVLIGYPKPEGVHLAPVMP